MGIPSSKVQAPPKETESSAGDAKDEGKTPRAPQDSFQGHAVFPNTQITVHNNSIDTCSSKGDETNTGSTQSHGIRPEDNILGNKDYTHFNVNTKSAEYSKSFNSSESINGTLQTITQDTELSIIDNDTGGNDQFDSGPVSQDKSDTASCPNVQTTNSDNYEQTDSITTNHGTKTKKNKKKKKKKEIVTPVMPEPSEPMKAGTTEQEVTDVKDKMRPCSPKETESPAGDAKYEGKTPTAPQDNFQGHADFLNTQITVHNNRIGTCSSKRNETTTRSTQNHGIRLEDNILSNKDNIFGNKDNTHFNVKNTHSEVYSKSSESTNGNAQTKAQIKEHSIINLNDIGGNDITQHDQYDIGSVSHDKSDTASCPIVQTANSDNYEQTDPITTNDGKETQKKKNKKKKGILTSLIPKPSKSMKTETTQCRPLQGEDTGVKNKMRHEPLEHMKAETTVYLLKQQNETGVKDEMRPEPMKAETPSYLLKQKDETGVKDEMRTEPPETMTTETTPYLFKQQDENGVKDEMRTEPPETMTTETTPYLFKQQDENGVKDEMRPEPMKAETPSYLLKQKDETGVKDEMRTEPPETMTTETTPYLFKQQDENGVKDEMRTEPPETMTTETTPYLFKQQDENGVKDEMRPEPMKAETPSYLLKQKDETGVKDEMRTEPPETMTTETTPYLFKQQDENGVKDEMRPEPMKAETPPYLLKQQDETGVKDEMSVTEQQLKTMTMEAERLTERCRYDIETSNANDKELKLCLKAFIQSISSVEKYISNLVLENSKLVMEKNEYLNRLSSAAGARLTDNNPNITNLHDPNRPMKLAEKFNKIYDDEWTDMIEMLEKKGHTTEEHKDNCVYHLYSVLIVIFNSLSKKAEVQLKGLGKHLFLLTKPSTEQINATWYDYKEERVQLIASRKKTAETTILMLYQTLQTDPIFLQELCECSPPLDDVMLSDILPSEYFMKCVEICWYFVIQDPPMYVETVSLKGIKIDKDTHKVYTKSGDIVKYHVWPALYLHHQDGTNSPLMGKGVVQPE